MLRPVAIGWFPADEWAVALERWPDLADEMPRDHAAYRAAIEAKVRTIGRDARGIRLVMTPLTVARIDAEAASEGVDAASTELRGRTAARLAMEGVGAPWPPGRNDPCWCGSSRKYKACCGRAPAPAPEPAGDTAPEQP